MHPASEILALRPRLHRRLRFFLPFILLAIPLSLTSCRYLKAATPAPTLMATAIPRHDPLPTIEVLDSRALYGQDNRAIGGTSLGLASFPPGAILPPVSDGLTERGVSIILDADTTLRGEYYPPAEPRQPGVLLLGDRMAGWAALPAMLAQSGFAVLVAQIEPLTPARQVEAMLQSFIAAPGVDAGSIGVIGADEAADIATLGCVVNSLCDALALLSPRSRDTLVNVMPSYGDRPMWLAAGQDDREALDTATALAAAAPGEAQVHQASAGRGMALLQRQPDLADELISWLHRHLKNP